MISHSGDMLSLLIAPLVLFSFFLLKSLFFKLIGITFKLNSRGKIREKRNENKWYILRFTVKYYYNFYYPMFSFNKALSRFVFWIMNMKIGKDSIISSNATLTDPWQVTIGTGSTIGENVVLGTSLFTEKKELYLAPIVIGNNSLVGANSKISPGCKIGNNVLIGPDCFIGQNVKIEDNVRILPRAVIRANKTVKESQVIEIADIY